MRTVAQLPAGIPKDVSSDFPDGTPFDDTLLQPGTPVVREIYGDILVNNYELLRVAGIVANGIEDSASNGYQLAEAYQKLPNIYSDIEQQLSLSGSVFSVPVDISFLPNKFMLKGITSAAFIKGNTYTFKGTTSLTYNFICANGFNAGDEILIVLDQTGVRAISLTNPGGTVAVTDITAPFGIPLAFNSGSKVWYQAQGILFSDAPETYDLQSTIRAFSGDGTIITYEMFVIGNYVLCFVFSQSNTAYSFYRFSLTNISANPILMTISGLGTGTDYQPFIYTDGINLYITNNSNGSSSPFLVDSYLIDITAGTLVNNASVSLNTGFTKTTNAVIKAGYLYTFIAGFIQQYNLATGTYVAGPTFIGGLGNIFGLNGNIYYLNEEVGKKWVLPIYS